MLFYWLAVCVLLRYLTIVLLMVWIRLLLFFLLPKSRSVFTLVEAETAIDWLLVVITGLCMCAAVTCVVSFGQPPITVLHSNACVLAEKPIADANTKT